MRDVSTRRGGPSRSRGGEGGERITSRTASSRALDGRQGRDAESVAALRDNVVARPARARAPAEAAHGREAERAGVEVVGTCVTGARRPGTHAVDRSHCPRTTLCSCTSPLPGLSQAEDATVVCAGIPHRKQRTMQSHAGGGVPRCRSRRLFPPHDRENARGTGAPPAAHARPAAGATPPRPGGARRGRQPRPRESRQEVRPVLRRSVHGVRAALRPRRDHRRSPRSRSSREPGRRDVRRRDRLPRHDPQRPRRRAHDYEPPDPGPGPHELVESLERLRTLATLPEPERIALVRTIVDGDSASIVAKELGVSSHRVYALVHAGSARARKRAA